MEKRKVIIDCDPGIDDCLAILLALNSKELEVVGLTICSGNVPADLGAKNALKALQIAGRLDIPVYVGEKLPLKRELVTAQDTHGEDGIGENFYEDVNKDILEDGVDFIIDTLKNNEKVSIIALGPMTNIAKALMKDKEAFNNLDEFVSMGGAFRIHGNCSPVAEFNYWVDPEGADYVYKNLPKKIHMVGLDEFVSMGGAFRIHGNCSPVAEFNYWVDPEGADYVYKNLPKKIHMVGLDVTRKIVLTPNIIEFINRLDKEKAKFITEITRFYIDFHWEQEHIIGCVINDPLAVAYFIDLYRFPLGTRTHHRMCNK